VAARTCIAGRNAVLAALRGGREVYSVLLEKPDQGVEALAHARGISVSYVSATRLTEATGTDRHQRIAAYVGAQPEHSVKDLVALARAAGEEPFLVAVDGVQDVGNLGAIARTALLAGCHGLVVPERGTALVGPAAVKASSGALEMLAVAKVASLPTALANLKRENVWIVGADADDGKAPWALDLKGAVCIVVGSEHAGLSRQTRDALDARVRIPMPGGDLSLNVAAATAVLCFERVRQVAVSPK
jgi:23S rRNA (guanosine2251-2'-O)-methyltransferase